MDTNRLIDCLGKARDQDAAIYSRFRRLGLINESGPSSVDLVDNRVFHEDLSVKSEVPPESKSSPQEDTESPSNEGRFPWNPPQDEEDLSYFSIHNGYGKNAFSRIDTTPAGEELRQSLRRSGVHESEIEHWVSYYGSVEGRHDFAGWGWSRGNPNP